LIESSNGGRLRARGVISATGGFGSPHRPKLPGLNTFGGQVLHSGEYRTPKEFEGARVIVVGAGNSAVQIAADLACTGQVTLASRSPLRWIRQRPLGRDLHWWLDKSGLDVAPIARRWLASRGHPVLDDGRYRSALDRGEFDRRPMFTRVDGDDVVWADGHRERVDAVILATGFRPTVPFLAGTGALGPTGEPLHRGGVSTTVAGLGYVGLEFQRSFSSATIRGVGRDAAHVMRKVRSLSDAAPRMLAPHGAPGRPLRLGALR
jgi:putative flavoprotein involved in K+ transport